MAQTSDLRYLRVADALAETIATLGPNTLLPTENELAARFGVSRVTVRQALRLLEQAGSVTRMRGRGTIVSPPKITRNNIPMCTLEEDFQRQGIAYETRILDFDRTHRPSDAVRKRLRLPARSSVGRLRLVRLVDARIICYECRFCIPSLAKRLEPEETQDSAIVSLMSRLAGVPIEVVEFETEITPSGEEAALALGITPGTLMLTNSFVYFLENGVPVETGSISYRVDRCRFRAVGRFPAPTTWSDDAVRQVDPKIQWKPTSRDRDDNDPRRIGRPSAARSGAARAAAK